MPSAAPITFLYAPSAVRAAVQGLPHLSAALGDPFRAGACSVSFANGRASPRQLYRLASNLHYDHLQRLCEAIDRCLAVDLIQARVLRTRSRTTLGAALAEVGVADHFLNRASAITPFSTSSRVAIPEFLVSKGAARVVIEVYSPDVWPGLRDYTADIADALKNIDLPFDFVLDVDIRQARQPDSAPAQVLHPSILSAGLESQAFRAERIREVQDALARVLPVGEVGRIAEHVSQELNLQIQVSLVRSAPTSQLPAERTIAISGPTVGGYRPDSMMASILRRAAKKSRRAQASAFSESDPCVLVVDLSRAQLDDELSHAHYRGEFQRLLEKQFESGIPSYDAVALVRRSSGRPLVLDFLLRNDDSRLNDCTVAALFGPTTVLARRHRQA